jgi:alkanesulfonate monooxygenase SsuD/methylene tetrahydromethanopterin reductase-like flavin-dependent oxidoreductase (luciferase family)
VEFALFYEIPVARPWTRTAELEAYQNTLAQAVRADELGWHSVWSVEHHFLEEYSHCPNPEVLYGAIAARTERLRIGYGVRLIPRPYNHPVRSAESAAVLDLLSNGRVEFGTGRSSTRIEMEGFGIHPDQTRSMWREGVEHVIGAWTNDEYEFDGEWWSMPKRRVLPKPIQEPHPPVWGATGSEGGHRMMGKLGLGLLSFSVGTPPAELQRRIGVYREGLAECTEPLGKVVNPRAACFTMVNCAATREESHAASRESFEWYPRRSAQLVASVPKWLDEMATAGAAAEYGTYDYLQGAVAAEEHLDQVSFDGLLASGACIAGDPDDVVEKVRAYEATGADLLLCLVNPYNVSPAAVMQTIELMGKHVIPEFTGKATASGMGAAPPSTNAAASAP